MRKSSLSEPSLPLLPFFTACHSPYRLGAAPQAAETGPTVPHFAARVAPGGLGTHSRVGTGHQLRAAQCVSCIGAW